jgi:hypothetical protein
MYETPSTVQVLKQQDDLETSSRVTQRIIHRGAAWLRARWPVLVILALPVAILWHSLLGGSATTDSDAVFQWLPWSAAPALGAALPHDPLLFDEAQQVSPWLLFTRQQFLAGRLPLWDSWVAGGTPFLAAGQTAVFYPLTWLGVLLPYPFSMTVMTLLKWWLVGLGMYAFARQSLRLSQAAGLVSALSFMFSSFIVAWLIHPVGEAAMLLPWLMWATERAIRDPSLRRVGALALVMGLVGLTGHPEMAFHVTLGATLYAFWLVGMQPTLSWRARVWLLGRWLGGAALGICLAAIQYLPTVAVLPLAQTTAQRTSAYGGITVPISGVVTWLVPNFWGNPVLAEHLYWGPRNYNEEVWYAGVVALVLALVALLALRRYWRARDQRDRARHITFFALLVVVFAALLYRLPVIVWVTRVPPLQIDSWTRLGVLAIFGVSALAGFGFEEMLTWGQRVCAPGSVYAEGRRSARQMKRQRMWLALGGLFALLPLLLGVIGSYYQLSSLDAAWRQFAVLWMSVSAALLWTACLALFLRWQGWLTGRVVGTALLGLMLCDQLLFAVPLVPQTSTRMVYPEIPAIARLQQTAGAARITAADGILIPDTTLAYHLNDLGAYETTTSSRYLHYMQALDPSVMRTTFACCQFLRCPSPVLLAVASVDFYATPANFDANACESLSSDQERPAGPLVPLWTEGGITLWRIPLSRPRFYFADQVIPSSSEKQTLAALSDLTAAGREAIIEGASPAARASTRDAGAISVVIDQPGQITLRTQTGVARWLVIDEGYDPGWQADVDGASTAVHAANEMFQAVFVPAGAHALQLSYRPLSFIAGVLLSALALLAVLVLGLAEWALRRLHLTPRVERRRTGADVRMEPPPYSRPGASKGLAPPLAGVDHQARRGGQRSLLPIAITDVDLESIVE